MSVSELMTCFFRGLVILLSIIGFCIGAIGATLRAGIWIVVFCNHGVVGESSVFAVVSRAI